MALNIKPYYPFDHPDTSLSVAELIKKISRPQLSAAYLKADVEKESTFNRNEDIYGFSFRPKKQGKDLGLNHGTLKLLDTI